MAKQLPGPKGAGVIRVQMDEAELHRLLDPILQEVNSLRARVLDLETHQAVLQANLSRTVDCVQEATGVLEVLGADYRRRQDDGK